MNYIDREEIKLVSAASGGLFTAYALSADKLDMVENIYRKVDISRKTELLWQVFAKNILGKYLDALMDVSDELEIPICFPVSYLPILSTRYYFIKEKYNRIWRKHIMAATNFPFLKIIPSFLHGRIAIDGGAVDNIPLYPIFRNKRPVYEDGELDLIIALHFDARYDYRAEFTTDIPVLEIDLSACNGFNKAHYDFSHAEIEHRLKTSYEYGDKLCSRLFGGECTEEELKKTIDEIFLEEHTARQKSFSSDRLVTILNVIAKALRSDSRCMKKLF